MRKLFLFSFILFLCTVQSVWATPITITGPTDLFTTDIGDYAAVSGSNEKSSPGQVFEVLGGPHGDLDSKGSESETKTWEMKQLYNALAAGEVTTATSLVFGFGVNETGNDADGVTITDLDMSFERAGASPVVFSLRDDTITVFNYTKGASTAEAQIQVYLGFDFMKEYSSASTEDFVIFSEINNTSAGYEIYFLSSAFTASPPNAPVPEPATMLLLGSGIIGLAGFRRKFRK